MSGTSNASDKLSIDEKRQVHEEAIETVSSTGSIDYGGDSRLPPPPKLTAEQERKLYRKVDLWLMPILTLMYLCSFLDRGNIGMCYHTLRASRSPSRDSVGNAKLQGLTSQLHLTGNKYNIALASQINEPTCGEKLTRNISRRCTLS